MQAPDLVLRRLIIVLPRPIIPLGAALAEALEVSAAAAAGAAAPVGVPRAAAAVLPVLAEAEASGEAAAAAAAAVPVAEVDSIPPIWIGFCSGFVVFAQNRCFFVHKNTRCKNYTKKV